MKIILLFAELVILSKQAIKDDLINNSQAGVLYLENENVFQFDKTYAIYVNGEDFNDMKNYSVDILEEISIEKRQFNDLNGNEKIFSLNKNGDDDIDIMLLKNGSIECLYQIKNYIQDDQIIMKSKECQILLNHQDCNQLYKLDQDIYIIQCNYNSTNTLIQIINQTQILDQIILPIQSNCQSDSIFNNHQTLIIFNKLCQTTIFHSISISNLLTFYNLTQYDLKDDNSIQDFTPSALFSMHFCSNDLIDINFHNLFITYILPQKIISKKKYFTNAHKIVQRFQSCESHSNYVELNENSNQLLVRKKTLNISTSFYIQSYWINYLMVFHKQDELVVLFNNKVKQHITNSFQYVLALTELPVIFAIKEKLMIIYKVNYPQQFFTVSQDQHLLKKIRINTDYVFPPSDLFYSTIEVSAKQNLKFLLLTSKATYFIPKINSTVCIHHNILQKTDAFEILVSQEQSNFNIIEQNDNINFCMVQLISKGKAFVFENKYQNIDIIITQQDQILSIYTCEKNKLKHFNKILIQKNYRDILSFPHSFQLVIIYYYKIEFIEFQNLQVIQSTQHFDKKILNYYQNYEQINILFEDCTKADANIRVRDIQAIFQDKYPFDCKLSLQFIFNEIFITQDKMLCFPIKGFRRKLVNLEGQKNIMTIVLRQFLILVKQVEDEYQLNLFHISKTEAIFLYNLPTYDFQIKDQISYQIFEYFLIIRAQKQDKNYLLTYDVSKTALLSLIRITQIDQYETFFQIISSDSFLYYFQDKFRIKNIAISCFNNIPKVINGTFILNQEFQFQIISQINKEILPFKLELISISDDYNLRILKQEQTIISKNTINLRNIHGNIEKIEILPLDDYQIIYPITFTDVHKDFTFYEQGICYDQSKRLIINCFDDHQYYIQDNTIEVILNVGYAKDKTFYQVFYQSITGNINFMTINIKLDEVYYEIKQTAIPDNYYKDLYNSKIKKIQTTQNLSTFELFYQNNLFTYNNIYAEQLREAFKDNTLLEVAYLIDSTFLFLSKQSPQNIIMKFIVITEENEKEIKCDIRLQYQVKLNEIIPESLINMLYYQTTSLKIFEVQIEQEVIHFQIGVFFLEYFSILISYEMDINFQSMPKVENTAILRYQKDFSLERPLFVDNNITLLILDFNKIEFVYVYDTRRKQAQNNIDSIQRFENNHFTGMERFNQSHYLLKSMVRIQFITLDELKFTCQNECKPIQSIQLSNQVSKISIEISNFESKESRSLHYYNYIYTYFTNSKVFKEKKCIKELNYEFIYFICLKLILYIQQIYYCISECIDIVLNEITIILNQVITQTQKSQKLQQLLKLIFIQYQINKFYMFLKIFLLIKITLCQSVTTLLKEMNYNIFPDEKIFVKNEQYAININDDNLEKIHMNNYSVDILEEISIEKRQFNDLNGNEKIFSLNKNGDDDIDIMLLKNGSIECLYQIKNYIQDDQIIMKSKECQILLNHQDCNQLYKLDQDIYIIQCNYNSTNTLIQIINQTQILDQIILPIQSNCQSDSIFNNHQTLIIFNKLCQTTIFHSISISNLLTFYNLTQYDLKEGEGLTQTTQQLIDIQFISQFELAIGYTNCIVFFFLKAQGLSFDIKNQQFQIKAFYVTNKPSIKILVEIDQNNQQLYLNKQQLNFSSIGFQKVLLVKKYFYLFHFTDKIFVQFKKMYSNTISINTKNLVQIGELPYFIALSNKQLRLIKLIMPKSVVSYKNSDKLLVIQTLQTQFPSFILNLKLFDRHNPIQYFPTKKLYLDLINYYRDNQLICLSYMKFQRTLPIQITQIMEMDNRQIAADDYSIEITSSLNLNGIPTNYKFLFLHKFQKDQLVYVIIEENTIIQFIFYDNGKSFKTHKFVLLANLIDIFINRQQILITIVYEKSIEIYQLTFGDIQRKLHQTKMKIIAARQLNYFVYYLLENCNKVAIRLQSNDINFEMLKYIFDCKSSLQFIKEDVYIDSHSISLKHRMSFYVQKLTLKEQVIEVRNILTDHLLLFTCYKNKQYVKLYQVNLDEVFQLYTLPTYNYSIEFPFYYRIEKSILMIKARNSSQAFFILIYDVQKTAVECLIQITEIDEEERFPFDFVNEGEYFFQFQEQLKIQPLHQPCFYFKPVQDSLDFIYDKPLKIITYSQISNQYVDLEFHLIIINKNYTLQQLNLSKKILTGNIVNVDNIFGTVEKVEIIGTENILVNLPLTFNNCSKICLYYGYGVCVNRSSIIKNIFDQSISISRSQYTESPIFYVGFNPDDCIHAIYIKGNDSLLLNQFNFCNQNQSLLQNYKVLTNIETLRNFRQIQDLQIAGHFFDNSYFSFKQKKLLDNKLQDSFRQVTFDFFDAIKINNSTYLTLNVKLQLFELRLIDFILIGDQAQSDIIFYKYYVLNDMIDDTHLKFHQVVFKTIYIYQIINNINQIEILFIVFFKHHLAYLMKLTFDQNNLDQMKLVQQGMIRYNQDAIFEKLLFIDNDYIVAAFKFDEDTFINVFDISVLSKTKNIDSIQKLRDNNYTHIERYNATHFVIVESVSQSYHQVHLIRINKLGLECQEQCNGTAYLKLSNKVSQLLIEINFSPEQNIQKGSLIIILLIINFISILNRLWCKKKDKKKKVILSN
ncbi:unnamed protein product (macronuclear) [Paramecium tetraurelia]|uniref:Transmembrane protein n=1 Tax=Paramecium tetraurelia TaxID=5888 RepID=A0CCJ1_PARTE|nr:uncharacterized protein GSPATT00037293001 [Paramecium tetraurelia]CAK68508.1 unnamed protein product [Paramecium tetraurelia]|eukprot:XP_001435905.1 hypothetical protein (macronuclear) [Paramecium tetraurelia strain d4-2]